MPSLLRRGLGSLDCEPPGAAADRPPILKEQPYDIARVATALLAVATVLTGILADRFGFSPRPRMPTKLGFANPKWITATEVANTSLGGHSGSKGFNGFSGF